MKNNVGACMHANVARIKPYKQNMTCIVLLSCFFLGANVTSSLWIYVFAVAVVVVVQKYNCLTCLHFYFNENFSDMNGVHTAHNTHKYISHINACNVKHQLQHCMWSNYSNGRIPLNSFCSLLIDFIHKIWCVSVCVINNDQLVIFVTFSTAAIARIQQA